MRDDSVLTADDLPTLRRMAAHYRARAAHRGLLGRLLALLALMVGVVMVVGRWAGEAIAPDVARGLRGIVSLYSEPARGIELVPDETTDAEIAAMEAAGRIAVRRSDGPRDFDG